MDTTIHHINDQQIAEVTAPGILIHNAQDGLDILGNIYYQGHNGLILHAKNITPAFFDLKTGMAGEILQKFSNYRVRLAVVGDFTTLSSKSLTDFIRESNEGNLVCFVGSLEEALARLGA